MDSTAFGEALASHVRLTLAIAESSFDVRDLELSLVAIVRMVESHPEYRPEADQVLAELVPRLCETPPPSGLSDLLQYCVHTLDLPAVLAVARQQRSASLDELHRGESRRPWEHARRCEQVIEAADANWEARDMYASLSE